VPPAAPCATDTESNDANRLTERICRIMDTPEIEVRTVASPQDLIAAVGTARRDVSGSFGRRGG
jgi:hypothetical protein